MARGQVKWFDVRKGYGFIIGPEGQDVFVHYTNILVEGFKKLDEGQWVGYELIHGQQGCHAHGVMPETPVTPRPRKPKASRESTGNVGAKLRGGGNGRQRLPADVRKSR